MSTPILAIETSCDDTAAAIFAGNRLLSNSVASQPIHNTYGGVVPELASRAHQKHIIPIVAEALDQANLPLSQIGAIACTQGPGLLGSLLVGFSFAKAMALTCSVPLIPVHHIKAHLMANFIADPTPKFPFLGLVVSGGHTQLIWVTSASEMELLGQTHDDAAGEAFDKISRLMGLPYPGGVHIDQHAQQGDHHRFTFPISMMPNLDFSFSGIKTAVLYFLKKAQAQQPDFLDHHLPDLCASVQHTIVTMLTQKTALAMEQTQSQQLVLGGGVAANSLLRQRLTTLSDQKGWQLFYPPTTYCTDNAAMVGITAYHAYLAGQYADDPTYLQPMPRMRM